jgi:hypothetical protein
LAKTATERALRTALDHLARFAFYTRDNPFLSSRAAFDLDKGLRRELKALLDGEVEPRDWAEGDVGSELLALIRIGSVPRDLQLVAREGGDVVAAESVFAFFHARVFWWLVTILWTIEVAPVVDPLLGESIRSNRFLPEFIENPAASGLMFQEQGHAHARFKRFPGEVAKKNPGELLTAAVFDLRAFYYTVERTPSQILSVFFAAKGERAPRSRRLRVLNQLMALAHGRYADLCDEVKPRGGEGRIEGSSPLPLGPPSSPLLANMVMSLVHDDLVKRPGVLAIASYVDDAVIISDRRPELDESPLEFLASLGVVSDTDHEQLAAPTAEGLAALRLNEEKCGTSFVRFVPKREAAEEDGTSIPELAQSQWEAYVEDGSWPSTTGGREPRETILRAPLTRERVPRKLKGEILSLLEAVRIGMSGVEARVAFDQLISEIDKAQFIRLRPFWTEITVIALAAHGVDAVRTLTAIVRDLCETVIAPPGSTAPARKALLFGLRESWRQSLAQALAVATTSSQRRTLLKRFPRMDLGGPRPYSMKSTVDRAMRIRRRRLVPHDHVAVPLAEFSDWNGKLIGPGAFVRFLDWAREEHPEGQASELAVAVGRAVRFVRLHEACLAIHLWGGNGAAKWIEETFEVLGSQPLIQQELVRELREKAVASLGTSGRGSSPGHRIRIAMPGVAIAEDQLEAVLSKDSQRLWTIAKASQRTINEIVSTSGRKKANLLVLPEWSVMAQQLGRLMARASAHGMLIIAGQAPEIAGGEYRNRLWTGIPLTDRVGHRACLVPPPREKSFLSPEEKSAIEAKGIPHAEPSEQVEIFSWRGMLIASLLCFEFADLGLRQEVRLKTDLLTVSSLNHDWHYFDAIQEATTRDNYCLTVCVNTGIRPGTRIARPTRHEMAIAASVHGSDDLAVITRRVDMEPIVTAQVHQLRPDDPSLGLGNPSDDAKLSDYKPFPPV